MTYYVETSRPSLGVPTVRVIPASQFSRDTLSPAMTSVWVVPDCKSRGRAMVAIIEKASGLGGPAYLYMGGRLDVFDLLPVIPVVAS